MAKFGRLSEAEFRVKVIEVFESSDDDLTALPLKKIRKRIEQELKLPSGHLKSEEAMALLELTVDEFKVARQRKMAGIPATSNSNIRTKKYSASEDEIIKKFIDDYIKSHGLDLSHVSTMFRDEKNKPVRTTLWDELAILLPHRTRESIKRRGSRLVTKPIRSKKTWTVEEKSTLIKLVTKHGNDWWNIAKTLGRLDDDCKQMYKRLEPRKVTGRFSPEESDELIEAVRKVMGLSRNLPIIQFPDEKIPWKQVADKLENKRQSIDYLRHWPTAKRKRLLRDREAEARGLASGALAVGSSSSLSSVVAGDRAKDGDGETTGKAATDTGTGAGKYRGTGTVAGTGTGSEATEVETANLSSSARAGDSSSFSSSSSFLPASSSSATAGAGVDPILQRLTPQAIAALEDLTFLRRLESLYVAGSSY
jgi:mannitol/fructose-specific phosphotransferase system IIA component